MKIKRFSAREKKRHVKICLQSKLQFSPSLLPVINKKVRGRNILEVITRTALVMLHGVVLSYTFVIT